MRTHAIRNGSRAFTLLEMSIVLIIIALIVGAIVAGQSLVRSSQVVKIGADANQYITAAQEFRQQYGYMPGDFPNATQVWGRADGGSPATSNCTTPDTAASSDGILTCNGDGNGVINQGTHEIYRAWQHLAAAKLVVGKYTGIASGGWTVGVNVPGSGGVEKSGYTWWSDGYQATGNVYYDGNYDNILIFTKIVANGDSLPILIPKEAAQIDQKYDDGYPATGRIRSNTPGYNTGRAISQMCASSSSVTAVYVKSEVGLGCRLLFLMPLSISGAAATGAQY